MEQQPFRPLPVREDDKHIPFILFPARPVLGAWRHTGLTRQGQSADCCFSVHGMTSYNLISAEELVGKLVSPAPCWDGYIVALVRVFFHAYIALF